MNFMSLKPIILARDNLKAKNNTKINRVSKGSVLVIKLQLSTQQKLPFRYVLTSFSFTILANRWSAQTRFYARRN